MSKIKKPTKKTTKFLDYIECRNYLNQKYKCDQDNYAGCNYGTDGKASAPFQCFWHFIIEISNLSNGSFFYMNYEWLDMAEEDWQKEILERYLSEFGEGKDREIKFYVSW
jgi:hypothetical protein